MIMATPHFENFFKGHVCNTVPGNTKCHVISEYVALG